MSTQLKLSSLNGRRRMSPRHPRQAPGPHAGEQGQGEVDAQRPIPRRRGERRRGAADKAGSRQAAGARSAGPRGAAGRSRRPARPRSRLPADEEPGIARRTSPCTRAWDDHIPLNPHPAPLPGGRGIPGRLKKPQVAACRPFFLPIGEGKRALGFLCHVSVSSNTYTCGKLLSSSRRMSVETRDRSTVAGSHFALLPLRERPERSRDRSYPWDKTQYRQVSSLSWLSGILVL